MDRKKTYFDKVLSYIYRLGIKRKVKVIREKKKISVLFVLSDVSKWKSKALYDKMRNHTRFNPQIGITMRIGEVASENSRKTNNLITYLLNNKIQYFELQGNGKDPKFDIIIYQEPYIGSVPIHNSIYGNLNSLFISIHYGFHTTVLPNWYTQPFYDFCWFDCFENYSLSDQIKRIYKNRKNIVVTGLPMSDILLNNNNTNPWKRCNITKKKIIWAPHHTIGLGSESISYGNFLSIAEKMQHFAIKYSGEVQWAFKPHPWLRSKVEKVWGKIKTDKYYEFWEDFESSQAEYGEYVGLFQYSDAMIHDSSSFIIEYLYANKPTLFILNGKDCNIDLNDFAREAFESQLHAQSISEIEDFIIQVINNQDILKDKRQLFYNKNLLPPKGKTASDNIIDKILGHF